MSASAGEGPRPSGAAIADAARAVEPSLRPHVLETGIELSSALGTRTGATVLLKLENTQRTGSFKARGALSKLLALGQAERARGVVTASSGNHGLALAWAGKALGVSVEVHVPLGASPAKLSRITALGADLRIEGQDGLDSELAARSVAAESGRAYVSPYNDRDVIAGQGTIGVEILRALAGEPPLDALFVALGGGGLVAGIASVLKEAWPDLEVVACSPANSAVMAESVRAGRILEMRSEPTLSDGTAGGIEPDSITFGLCRELVDRYPTVGEEEIAAAMRHVLEVEHTLIEGAAAVPVAALLREGGAHRGRRVAVVLCGANVSLDTLRTVLSAGT